MREILFRGKRLDNGEWLQGYLWAGNDSSYIIPHSLGINYYARESRMMAFASEVDPETVCQYTGLSDRNGKRIFEGDIVAIPGSNKKGLPAEVRYRKLDCGFRVDRIGYAPISLDGVNHWGEVIGNVFDNPELIEWRRRGVTPKKPTDRGGYLTMPLVSNVPRPSDKTWKRTICPVCGEECWDRPLPEGFTEEMFTSRLCTVCALKAAGV